MQITVTKDKEATKIQQNKATISNVQLSAIDTLLPQRCMSCSFLVAQLRHEIINA